MLFVNLIGFGASSSAFGGTSAFGGGAGMGGFGAQPASSPFGATGTTTTVFGQVIHVVTFRYRHDDFIQAAFWDILYDLSYYSPYLLQ